MRDNNRRICPLTLLGFASVLAAGLLLVVSWLLRTWG